ncbi:hypothetical protein HK099_003889 [Clydaea vesicula]|uniref:Uncharacterized protein n=1 Tax=Clydaea vesicula TaxID=447962 RepID=A0AAD5U122_9FUNG|nr:hypothetical protein HK099_003889 [Clydaea vesicula]
MTRDNTVSDDISQHQILARLSDSIVRMYTIYSFFSIISLLVVYLITITTYENSMQTSKVLSLVNSKKPNFPDERA